MAYKRLSPDEWIAAKLEVHRGDSIRSVAPKYGISEAALRRRINSDLGPNVVDVAQKLAAKKETARVADKALAALPVALRARAFSLSESLLEMSNTVLLGAELASKTALKLQRMANFQASLVDEEEPDSDRLRMVHGLIETANKAAQQPLELIKANRDLMQTEPEDEVKTGLEHFYGGAA